MTPQKMLKTAEFNENWVLWAWKNFWGYDRKVHAKFWPWGCPGTRVMTMLGSYVGSHFPNIGYLNVYDGISRYIKVFRGI